MISEGKNIYASVFESGQSDPSSRRAPGWVRQLRTLAMERFDRLDFPTTADEEWKYSDVTPVRAIPYAPSFNGADLKVSKSDLGKWISMEPDTPACDGALVVFVNGRYSRHLSRDPETQLSDQVQVGGIADILQKPQGAGPRGRDLPASGSAACAALEENLSRHAHFDLDAFSALNTAFLDDGAFVYIPANAHLVHPVNILHLSIPSLDGKMDRVSHPRNLIVVGDGSEATVIETYVSLATSDAPSFANVVTEIVAGKDSRVDHYKIQKDEGNGYHIGTTQIVLDRGSQFVTHTVIMGTKFCRNTVGAFLNAEGIECTLNGLYVVKDREHVDNHTAIDHAKPHCASHELYKGILDGRSRAVFNGKVFVRKDAQKTDAKQTNRNLLLSDEAIVDTKPQLEIFADDVKCTHGATVGQLDESAIFYLQSRGLSLEDARSLLTYAFAGDILKRIKVISLAKQLDAVLMNRLHSRFQPL